MKRGIVPAQLSLSCVMEWIEGVLRIKRGMQEEKWGTVGCCLRCVAFTPICTNSITVLWWTNEHTVINCTFILQMSYRRHRAWVKQIKMKDLKIFQNTWLSPSQSILEVWVQQQLPVGVCTVMRLVQVPFLNTSFVYFSTLCCSLFHR